MNTIKPSEINRLLGEKASELCAYLLPNGKRNGQHWEIGSVSGEPGQSCKVYLDGKGYYDFALSDGGDYLKLWQEVRGCDFPVMIEDAKAWLGIYEPERKKSFSKAVKPKTVKSLSKQAFDYLQSRGLSVETIKTFKVVQDSIKGQPAVFFPFLIDGELKHFKLLGLDRPGGKKQIRASEKTEPCLFGWQAVKSSLRAVVICEGEIDAMTFHQYGFGALSVPFGGGTGAKQDWIESEYGRMARFEEIFISMDNDETGQSAAKEIANRLGLDRCKIVKLPKKDINECLAAGITKEEIMDCLSKSKHLDIDEIKRPSDFESETIELMYSDEGKQGFNTPWGKVNAEWRPGWNELTLVNGINAHGKSDLANMLMLHAALKQDIACLIASMEIPHKLLNRRLIRQSTARTKPVEELAKKCLSYFDEKIWFANFPKSFSSKSLIETMIYAYRRYNTKIFLVDSLMKCGIAEEDYSGQKLFVEKLCEIKNQYPIHIFLVVHPRKGLNEKEPPGKMDVAGAGGITNLADNLLTAWRNKEREQLIKKQNNGYSLTEDQISYIDKTPAVLLSLQKDRNGGNEQSFKLAYRNYQFLESESSRNFHYVEGGVEV